MRFIMSSEAGTKVYFSAKRFVQLSVFVLLFMKLDFCFSQNDSNNESAMRETQDFLKSEAQRKQLFKNDEKARMANDRVDTVTGGDKQNSQKLYEISAEIMPFLMKTVGNDPNKAMELLQKAQSDPEAFYKSLPADIKSQIRGVASDIESKGLTKKQP